MKKIILSTIAALSLFGLEFQPLGFKAIGMGGAGVANASGSLAAYYNPALLTKTPYTVEFSLSAGVGVREVNLLDPIDKLANDYQLTDTIDLIAKRAPISGSNTADGTNIKMENALNEIYKLSQGNGANIEPTAAFGFQAGNFAVGVYALGDLTANAVIDRQRLYLIFKDDTNTGGYYYYYPKTDTYGATDKTTYENYSLEYALDNNLTYLNVDGIALAEVPVSYATSFDVQGAEISIGINLKYLQGMTYKSILALDTDSTDLKNSLDTNKKTSTNYGVDIGFLLDAGDFRMGLVGKYLNSPEFDYYDGSKYKVKPMVRGGMAVDLTDWLTFAMDIDLTENETGIKDFKSQYIGGGLDIHPGSWMSIRAGAMRNMVQDEEGTILTAGLGFGLKWFQLDLAAQASTKTGSYDGNEIPRYFKVNLAILSRWGSRR
ncbi:conjugal transfer protein TraF [Nautilia sp.]